MINKEYLDLKQYGKLFRGLKVSPYNVTIIYRKDQNKNYERDIIYDVNDNLNFVIDHNHVISALTKNDEKIYLFGYTGDEYSIKDIRSKYTTFYINTSGSNGIHHVVRILKEHKLDNFNMAEVGVQYGSTAQLVIDNFNIKQYDMYDFQCDLLRSRFGRYDFVNIIEGNAINTMHNNNTIYDAVFYDCSHRYDIDIKILRRLLIHLNNHSIVIFHDYDMTEVRRAIEEFCTIFNGTVYALDKNKVLKLK